jgi:hypothetical protein
MKSRTLASSFLLVLVVLITACGKKSKSDDVPWPEKPASGAPVVAQYLGIEGEGAKAQAKLRLFNFEDKSAVNVVMYVRYLDASGKELRSTPANFAAPRGVVKGKQHTEKKMFGKLPEGTDKVEAEVRKVEFDGAPAWEHPAGMFPRK